jgi:hypothetical protein
MSEIRKPAPRCCVCQKTLEEIGGERITAQQVRKIFVSDKKWTAQDVRDKDNPVESIALDNGQYLIIQGWSEEKTPGIIERAKQDCDNGDHPWFCQVCGARTCHKCGHPTALPFASDLLKDDGSKPHFGVFPASPGCINPECENYRKRS